MSTEFLTAAKAILTEYGEPGTTRNRSGTTISTTAKVFKDDGLHADAYWPEGAGNALEGLSTIYGEGDLALAEGYDIVLAEATYEVVHLASYKEGTTNAIHIAKCRKKV